MSFFPILEIWNSKLIMALILRQHLGSSLNSIALQKESKKDEILQLGSVTSMFSNTFQETFQSSSLYSGSNVWSPSTGSLALKEW